MRGGIFEQPKWLARELKINTDGNIFDDCYNKNIKTYLKMTSIESCPNYQVLAILLLFVSSSMAWGPLQMLCLV